MAKQVTKNKLQWALISGGSKGIGYGIALALARRNYNLVLVARNEDDLNNAKTKLESIYSVQIEILPFDLGQEESAVKIGAWCTEKDLPLKILCNVTGLGGSADYLSAPLTDSLQMLRLNTEPAVSLVFHLLPLLKKNQPAYILNVSSMAGFAPITVKNIYSATKSAVIFFSYSLRYQLKKDHISVSCLCPGPVFTKPSVEKETIEKLGWFGKKMAVSPEELGEIAVNKTLKKAMIIVPGFLAKTVSVILRTLPKKWIAYIYYKLASTPS
jgi:short-subunit dehydrogenase